MDPGEPPDSNALTCDLPAQFLVSSPVGRDGIPSLQNPEFTSATANTQNSYLQDEDRVLGFFFAGEPVAVPHNILWYHEVVNLDQAQERIAITYCPLTGSPVGFDRTSVAGDQLGISGLLFMNNLVLYNRGDPESFWPQMLGEARCGPGSGDVLERIPLFEMTWSGWRDLYPTTTVVSSEVNISRDYTVNPYADYESLDNETFLYANMPPLDRRRPVKERVLGLPSVDGTEVGIAFPYLALEAEPGSWTTLQTDWNGQTVVVLWADQREGGGVFLAEHPLTGEPLEFNADSGQGIKDSTTGTTWSVTGEGLEGELAGLKLESIPDAHVAFWGAWAAFHPDTRLWEGN